MGLFAGVGCRTPALTAGGQAGHTCSYMMPSAIPCQRLRGASSYMVSVEHTGVMAAGALELRDPGTAPGPALLRVKRVSVTFRRLPVLDDVDFEVWAGPARGAHRRERGGQIDPGPLHRRGHHAQPG